MTTQEQNQQIIVEHITNIDTTAEHISAINSVANIVVQMVAVAGMLPDIAATVTLRSTLLAVSKKLEVVQSVADAVPLLEAVRHMESDIRAAISSRVEISAVVAHLEAVRSLASQLDVLIQAPQHAAEARLSADAATEAASQIDSQMNRAETARLGAELAEDQAKASSETAAASSKKSAASAIEAKKAADAASAVSGLPDASAASPGDPLIWDGTRFAVGTLADSLAATDDGLAVAETVLQSITTAQATANALDGKVTAAQSAATEAKATADGVDAKATQAASDAATAKGVAESAGASVATFEGRLATAENETFLLGQSQNGHINNGDIHTAKSAIEAIAAAAVNLVKDGGDGSTLPEDRATLLALSSLINENDLVLNGFLNGTEPGERMAILAELDRLASTLGDGLTRADVVNALDNDAQDMPLAAGQGPVLTQMIGGVRDLAESAAKKWVLEVFTVPEAWPDDVQPGGLLLFNTLEEGTIANPQWYVNRRNIPVQLVMDATGIRLLDGTTVQTGVASSLAASLAAQAAAEQAKAAAQTAKVDAEQAKVDAEQAKADAEQAKADAEQAKVDAETAKSTADGVDAKATQAQADAAEALAKTPDLATQMVPGIVKGSSTVTVDSEGALHVAGGGSSAETVGSMKLWHASVTPPQEWEFANGGIVAVADYPDLFALIGHRYSPADTAEGKFCLPSFAYVGLDDYMWVRTVPSRGENSYAHIALDYANGDKWGCVRNGETAVLREGADEWQSMGGAGTNRMVSVNVTTKDVWVATEAGEIKVLRGGAGEWVSTGSGVSSWFVVWVNSTTGDVFAGTYNGEIKVLRGGAGEWVSTGSGVSSWYSMCGNSTTGDVFAGTYNGEIKVLRGGSGPYETIDSNKLPVRALCVDILSGDVFLHIYSVGIKMLKGGKGPLISTNGGPTAIASIVFEQNDGAMSAFVVTENVTHILRNQKIAAIIKMK